VSTFCSSENVYKKLSAEILCQNSRLPRLPKEYFFKRFSELLSMLFARLRAASSMFLSSKMGFLHLVKNVRAKRVVMKIKTCLKLAYNVSGLSAPAFGGTSCAGSP